jgi:LysR family transcriptional activator of nhaA
LPGARGLTLLGRCPDVVEHFHAIVADRKVEHPVVRKLLDQADTGGSRSADSAG